MDRKNNLNFSVVFYEFIQRLIFWCFSVSLSKYFFKTKYFEDTSNVSHAVKCNMKAGELLRTLCCFQLKVSRVTMYSRSILFSISKTEFPNYASLCRHSQYISLWVTRSAKKLSAIYFVRIHVDITLFSKRTYIRYYFKFLNMLLYLNNT